MNKDFSLSIVIPVFNAENTISLVVEKINQTIKNRYRYEIILVNDGSIDNSYKVCKKLAEKINHIRFIDLSKNFGQHNAVMAGLRQARGSAVISMDDDLQTPPEELLKLIKKLDEGYDVVYAKYKEKKHSFSKRIGSRLNDLMLSVLMDKPKDLSLSSYFILRKYIVEEITKYDGPNPYIWGLVLRTANRITNVEVNHSIRHTGKTGYNFKKLTKLFFNGFIGFSILPLRILLVTGTILAAGSLIFIILIIIQKLNNPGWPAGWASITVVILFFSGINLVSAGLLGEYIGRVFLHQSKYTQYLIREKINANE